MAEALERRRPRRLARRRPAAAPVTGAETAPSQPARRRRSTGWNEYAIGGLQIIDVDGDHVQSLGKAMAAALSSRA
jgi:hypothetical protein